MTSRDTRAEQCLAFGRSATWMLAHGYTQTDIDRAIRRMDAADRGDNAAWIATLGHDDRKRVVRANRPAVRENERAAEVRKHRDGSDLIPGLAEKRLL